mgnify:CR=1 FL=1
MHFVERFDCLCMLTSNVSVAHVLANDGPVLRLGQAGERLLVSVLDNVRLGCHRSAKAGIASRILGRDRDTTATFGPPVR